MGRLKDTLIENPYWEIGYIHGASGITMYTGIKQPLGEINKMAYEGAFEHGESDRRYGTVELGYFTAEAFKRMNDAATLES